MSLTEIMNEKIEKLKSDRMNYIVSMDMVRKRIEQSNNEINQLSSLLNMCSGAIQVLEQIISQSKNESKGESCQNKN